MEIISNLFDMAPFVALFITLSLGYMVGKITIGRFVLGGVTEEAKHLMQTNVAVGYAVTYIFGSL